MLVMVAIKCAEQTVLHLRSQKIALLANHTVMGNDGP